MTKQTLKDNKASIIAKFYELGGRESMLILFMERMLTMVECDMCDDYGINTWEHLCTHCMCAKYQGDTTPAKFNLASAMANAHDHKTFCHLSKSYK